jgi:hypothetical protein
MTAFFNYLLSGSIVVWVMGDERNIVRTWGAAVLRPYMIVQKFEI